MKKVLYSTLLLAFTLPACDQTGGQGAGDTAGWETPPVYLGAGGDPCDIFAFDNGLVVVEGYGLVSSVPYEFKILPSAEDFSGNSVIYDHTALSGLGGWSFIPEAITDPRPLSSNSVEFKIPNDQNLLNLEMIVWVIANGPVRHKQVRGGYWFDVEGPFVPYANLNGDDDYKLATAALGINDGLNHEGSWTIEGMTPVARLMGAVRESNDIGSANIHARPPAKAYYQEVTDSDDVHRWLPYGGICFLGAPPPEPPQADSST